MQAFFQCASLEHLVLPTNLKTIGMEAFAECKNLKGTVRLPDSLEKVGYAAFRGTEVTLSINKNRQHSISFASADLPWVSRHIKGITVQESIVDDNHMVNEEILDEKLPRDLAQAYRTATQSAEIIRLNPDSAHDEISRDDRRRGIVWDYDAANYEVITPEQARVL